MPHFGLHHLMCVEVTDCSHFLVRERGWVCWWSMGRRETVESLTPRGQPRSSYSAAQGIFIDTVTKTSITIVVRLGYEYLLMLWVRLDVYESQKRIYLYFSITFIFATSINIDKSIDSISIDNPPSLSPSLPPSLPHSLPPPLPISFSTSYSSFRMSDTWIRRVVSRCSLLLSEQTCSLPSTAWRRWGNSSILSWSTEGDGVLQYSAWWNCTRYKIR